MILIAIPCINLFHWRESTRIGLVLLAVFICGALASILQLVTFGIAAVLPQNFTGAIMLGQAFCGILALVWKICINYWWFPAIDGEYSLAELNKSSLTFFGFAIFLLHVTIILFYVLTHSEYYYFYYKRANRNHNLYHVEDNTREKTVELKPSVKYRALGYLDIFSNVKWEALNVFHIMLLSLFLYPFVIHMRNYDSYLHRTKHALFIIVIWQVMDFFGRLLTRWCIFPKTHDKFWIPTWLRVLFIPFVMIYVYTDCFRFNALAYIITALVAFTHGYFSTLCMVYAPKRVPADQSMNTGILMAFFLQLGIFVGVNLSTVILLIIEGPSVLGL